MKENLLEPKNSKWWLWLVALAALTILTIVLLKSTEARVADVSRYHQPVQWQDVESHTGTHKAGNLQPLPSKLGGNTASINLRIMPNPENKVTLKDWYIKQAHKKTSKISVASSRTCRKQFGRYNAC